MLRRHRLLGPGQRGATAILVAGVMVFLMAFAWLAIDAGLGFDDRRGTQNAADLAALAGAWEACNPTGTGVEAAAREVAARNGYPEGGGTTVTVAGPSGDANQVTVTIRQENESIFGGAGNAPDTIEVLSEATAECEVIGFLGDYAVFGGHQGSCPTQNAITPAVVELIAGNVTVNGDVHSNERLHIGGSSPVVNGTATHRSGTNFPPAEQHYGAPLDQPLELGAADFAPGQPRVDGLPPGRYHDLGGSADAAEIGAITDGTDTNQLDSGVLTINVPGVYYTSGALDLGSNRVVLGASASEGATFVSGGQMNLGRLSSLHGYAGAPVVPGGTLPVLALSDAFAGQCDPYALLFRADGGTLTGLLHAPDGDIQIEKGTGSPNLVVNGSMIAYEISFNTASGQLGSFTINYQDDDVPPEYRVELID